MALKRPYDDEVVNEVSSKHQRQDGPHEEGSPYDEGFRKEADCTNLHSLGEASNWKGEVLFRDNSENGCASEALREAVEETESDAPRSASLSHWATSSTGDEDEPPEEMGHLPFYSGYFSFDRPVWAAIKPGDVYYCLLDYPPRKQVPIGPEHQAEIPAWGESTSDGDIDLHLGGICILPNPETQPVTYDSKEAVNGWECECLDRGSIRCVRQHIAEARDKMRRILGPETFMELGFHDMGEVVADKWTDEEEQLFNEVVYSNPAALGKNFWIALSALFPSRTKMEIVSYYFNVFMLRKRAEQNRFDPINVDSDNDEWQGNDEDGADEGGESEDDEDSGIESPMSHDGITFHQKGLHVHEHEEDDGNVSDEARETDENDGKELVQKSNTDNGFELIEKKADCGGENDIQDGSCTSSDSGCSLPVAQMRSDGSQEWHGYMLASADGKAWDGYLSCPKSNVDFLPTCRMIEEVFGDEDFDSKNNRW